MNNGAPSKNIEKDYTCYICDEIIGIGTPHFIITYAQNGLKHHSEYFIFLTGEVDWFSALLITCDSAGIPADLLTIDKTYMVTDAIQRAKETIRHFLNEKIISGKRKPLHDFFFSYKPDPKETSNFVIYKLLRTGKFPVQFQSVQKRSRCEDLRKDIEIYSELSARLYTEDRSFDL